MKKHGKSRMGQAVSKNKNLEHRNVFSAGNQPTGSAKSEGWKKKKQGIELAKAVLDLAFQGAKNTTLKKDAALYFGIPETEITVELLMHFRQAEKAIQKADTPAYNALMNRAFGLPKQIQEVVGKGGKELFPEKTDDELKQMLLQTLKKLDT